MRRPRAEIMHLLSSVVLAAAVLMSCASPSPRGLVPLTSSDASAYSSGPVHLSGNRPEYPPAARREGIEGRVVAHLYVDVNGDVTRVLVVKSPHDVLAQDLPATFKRWKFRPPQKDGKPVEFIAEIVVDFRLSDPLPQVLGSS